VSASVGSQRYSDLRTQGTHSSSLRVQSELRLSAGLSDLRGGRVYNSKINAGLSDLRGGRVYNSKIYAGLSDLRGGRVYNSKIYAGLLNLRGAAYITVK
jgi:hypothetical protein